MLPNDDMNMRLGARAVELVKTYCPPDREFAYLSCDNSGSFSQCLDCWIEWLDDAGKTGGLD